MASSVKTGRCDRCHKYAPLRALVILRQTPTRGDYCESCETTLRTAYDVEDAPDDPGGKK